jgi:hypothetical protein
MLNPEPPDNQRENLLNEVYLARKRYRSKEGVPEEYAQALKRFGDFIIRGKIPEERTLAACAGA